jgi:WD40 repeat protein
VVKKKEVLYMRRHILLVLPLIVALAAGSEAAKAPPVSQGTAKSQPKAVQAKAPSAGELRVRQARNAAGGEKWAEVVRVLPEEEVAKWDRSDPSTPDAYFLLGRAYQALKDWERARRWYAEYMDANPTGLYRNDCMDRLGLIQREYWDGALREIQRILADPGLDPQRRYESGQAVVARAKAITIPGVSDEGDLLYAQGVLTAGVQRTAEARKSFQDYRRGAPNGRFSIQALYYLSQLGQPRLLYIQGGRLRSVLEDGSDPRTLTTQEQGDARDVALSPSRDYVAVLTWSEKTQTHTVYVLNLSDPGVRPRSIWSCPGQGSVIRDVTWSPSLDFPRQTRFLAFIGPDSAGDYAIWTYDVSQTDANAKKLAHSNAARVAQSQLAFSWAPGGKFIAFCAGDGRFYVSQPLFETAQALEPDVAAADPSSLTWAVGPDPDSDPVLFGLSRRGVFILNGKDVSSARTTVRLLDRVKQSPADRIGVSSEGNVIAVQRKQPSGNDLELYRVKDQLLLGAPIRGVTKFAFSPIGGRLAYRTTSGVYTSRLDDDRQHDVRLSGTDGITDFAWSPMGNQILWWRKDRIALCFDQAQLGGGHLPPEDSATFVEPKWAVDDRAVAVQRVQENEESILLLVRGASDTQQQIHRVELSEPGTAHLVDWVH